PARGELGEPEVAVGPGGDACGLTVLGAEGEVRRRPSTTAGGRQQRHDRQARDEQGSSDPGRHVPSSPLPAGIRGVRKVSPQSGGFVLWWANSFNNPIPRQSAPFRR